MMDINELLNCMKHIPQHEVRADHTAGVHHVRVSDSAYRADYVNCLALRTVIITVIEMRGGAPAENA
eukprot:741639-Heterocapsa_arctica.AAC.1